MGELGVPVFSETKFSYVKSGYPIACPSAFLPPACLPAHVSVQLWTSPVCLTASLPSVCLSAGLPVHLPARSFAIPLADALPACPTACLACLHCKSRPSQNELHIPWKELDLVAWGRQSSKLVWYVSTNNFCFSFPKICRSNKTVHLRTVISLFNVNYKLLYISIFVCKEL